MRVSADTNSKLVGFIETVTGLGLRIGIFVFALAAIYLLIIAFGNQIRHLAEMKPEDREYLVNSVSLVLLALKVSGAVIIASIAIRLFFEETVGLVMTIVGGALYFGFPILLASFAESNGLAKNTVFASIGGEFRNVGAICLLTGVVFVVRDVFLRVWRGIAVLRVPKGCEDSQTFAVKRGIYERCWDMPFCRPAVRNRCPVFIGRKTCWKTGYGCYCDARTITQLSGSGSKTASGSLDSEQTTPAATRPKKSARQVVASCRQCIIYAEHQRQKYRIFSALVLPGLGLLFYKAYGPLSSAIWTVMEKVDRFMSVLAYRPGGAQYSFSNDGHILTTLAIIWLAIMAVSYTFRLLDYLIFDLQV